MKSARRRRIDRIDDEIDREERDEQRRRVQERRERNAVVEGNVYQSFIENADGIAERPKVEVTVGEPGDLNHASTLAFDPNASQVESALLADPIGASYLNDDVAAGYASPVVYYSDQSADKQDDTNSDKDCGDLSVNGDE